MCLEMDSSHVKNNTLIFFEEKFDAWASISAGKEGFSTCLSFSHPSSLNRSDVAD